MKPSGIITLLTDFGLSDPYVGVMKGAVLTRFRDATLVDLTHLIAPGDVRAASFWLGRAYPWFAPGTVHLAVVDPGVGSERRALAIAYDGHYFVGPDNGLFSFMARGGVSPRVVSVDPARLGVLEVSRTFHGRDVFAPAAAELARGALELDQLGPPGSLAEYSVVANSANAGAVAEAPAREAPRGNRCATGRVVLVDHFGNLITDIEGSNLTSGRAERLLLAGQTLPIVETYAQANPGECVGLVGSFGTLEIAARDASAADLLGVGKDAEVVVLGTAADRGGHGT